MIPLSNKQYEIIYEKNFVNCPVALKEEFINDLREISQAYKSSFDNETLEKISKAPSKDHEALAWILSGLPKKRINESKAFSLKEYDSIKNKYSIPNMNKELSEKFRTLPGALSQKIRRFNKISSLDALSIKKDYDSGFSTKELIEKYGYNSLELIRDSIKTSSRNIRKDGLDILTSKTNEWYHELWNSNPFWSYTDLISHLSKTYEMGNVSEKTFIHFFKKIGIESTNERRNLARSIKSKNNANESWLISVKSSEYIKQSKYKTEDNLTLKYCSSEIGTFRKIADDLNNELNVNHFTVRRVEKIITRNPYYVRKDSGSIAENVFINEIVKALNLQDSEYLTHYIFSSQTNSTIDLFIPKYNLGIEFNGDYWHSNEVVSFNYGMTAFDFHKKKYVDCENEGIKLLYVWESDFDTQQSFIIDCIVNKKYSEPILNKFSNEIRESYSAPKKLTRKILKDSKIDFVKDKSFFDCGDFLVKDFSEKVNNYAFVVKAREKEKELITVYPWHDETKISEFLKYKSSRPSGKIYARKCLVESSPKMTKIDREFLENNHILGNVNFRNIVSVERLIYNNDTVALALFTKIDETTVELRRLAFIKDYSIPGGASRLLKNFVRNNTKFKKMITFSDNNLSEGKIYETLGFELVNENKGVKVWFHPKTKQKFTDQSLYRIGADRLLRKIENYKPVGIGPDLPSNSDIVQKYGFKSINDCGYKKWEMSLNA